MHAFSLNNPIPAPTANAQAFYIAHGCLKLNDLVAALILQHEILPAHVFLLPFADRFQIFHTYPHNPILLQYKYQGRLYQAFFETLLRQQI